MLQFLVNHQALIREDHLLTVADSRDYLTCRFTFQTPEWTGISVIAVFRNGETVKRVLVGEDGTCEVPETAIKEPGFYVSLTGGSLIPTNEVRVHLTASAANYEDSETPLDESLYDQLIDTFTEKSQAAADSAAQADESAKNAKTAAQSAQGILTEIETAQNHFETFVSESQEAAQALYDDVQEKSQEVLEKTEEAAASAELAGFYAGQIGDVLDDAQSVLHTVQAAGEDNIAKMEKLKNAVQLSQNDVSRKAAQTAAYAGIAAEQAERAEEAAEKNQSAADEAAKSADDASRSAEMAANIQADIQERQADITQKHGEVEADRAEVEENAGAAEQAKEGARQAYSDFLNQLGTDVATLVGGKIPMSQIPATATQEIYQVSSEDELTDLIAQRGDLAELIETVDGEKTVTKTWQCLGDASIRDNWVVWGTSYAVQAGNAETAASAENANTINHHRVITMSQSEFETAVKDENTLYLVGD